MGELLKNSYDKECETFWVLFLDEFEYMEIFSNLR